MADSDKVPPVSDQDFDAKVLKAELPTLVDFWAVWCGPCKMVAPVVEEAASDFEGRVSFAKMNVDENMGTPVKYGIRGIPTLLLFKGGEVVDQIVGAVPKGKLKEMLEKHL
ncbi:MAG: thioredoxin [Myxococcota bacterium]